MHAAEREAHEVAAGRAGTTRAQMPNINIEETCRAAAHAMVSLMGGTLSQNDFDLCMDSEKKAHQQILSEGSISTRRAVPFSHHSVAVKRTHSDTSIGSFSIVVPQCAAVISQAGFTAAEFVILF